MIIKKLVVEFVTMFVAALATTAFVTFLWNVINHGASAIDWGTSFRFAIIFGIILTWVSRGKSKKSRYSNWCKRLVDAKINHNKRR